MVPAAGMRFISLKGMVVINQDPIDIVIDSTAKHQIVLVQITMEDLGLFIQPPVA
jgi:hypothetical protein